MSINIDPEKFAELVVNANPQNLMNQKIFAKESLTLYINAYRLAENIQTLLLIVTIQLKSLKKSMMQTYN